MGQGSLQLLHHLSLYSGFHDTPDQQEHNTINDFTSEIMFIKHMDVFL